MATPKVAMSCKPCDEADEQSAPGIVQVRETVFLVSSTTLQSEQMNVMSASDLGKAYLDALNRSDLEAVQAMFPANGTVVSPLYGEQNAHAFYARLFSDTSRSDTTLMNIFSRSEDGNSVALHFKCNWTLSSGKLVSFECVDVFELTEDRTRFQKLTIIYDTAPLREDFEQLKT